MSLHYIIFCVVVLDNLAVTDYVFALEIELAKLEVAEDRTSVATRALREKGFHSVSYFPLAVLNDDGHVDASFEVNFPCTSARIFSFLHIAIRLDTNRSLPPLDSISSPCHGYIDAFFTGPGHERISTQTCEKSLFPLT